MEIEFLRHFGFKNEHIDILKKSYGPELLLLQERIIQEGSLFQGQSLVVRAPTSSGKTFLAEVLFLYHTLQNRNTILLVPTKALANQRYQQIKERYQPLGYDIILSTRDHPFDDSRILKGRFHLAVVIYEKMRSLLAMNDAFCASLGACIVDELHYVYDPERGADLEILLTRLREESHLQMLGLSALVSDESTGKWLGAQILIDNYRPVELKQGVLCEGKFTFKEFNSGKEGEEPFPLDPLDDDGEAMLAAADHFARNGETTLLFWPSRELCYKAAMKLADRYDTDFNRHQKFFETLEPTTIRTELSKWISSRVAVHTSDLTGQERALVERLVQEREVILICATPTLAEGINLPVVNVLTTHRMYGTRPEDVHKKRSSAPIPLSQERLFNMIGRAGRLGFSEFGRGIIVTTSRGDVDGLINKYLRTESHLRTPVLEKVKLQETILKSLIHPRGNTPEGIVDFLERTLSGVKKGLPEPLDDLTHHGLENLKREGLLSEESGHFFATPLGNLVIKNGLSISSAKRLEKYAKNLYSIRQSMEILLLVCMLEEMERNYISLPRNDVLNHTWSKGVIFRSAEDKSGEALFIADFVENPVLLRTSHHAAFKKTLLLYDWINKKDLLSLEKHYRILAGMIYRLAEDASWLIGCLGEICAAHMKPEKLVHRMFSLRERVLYGLPEKCEAWASLLKQQDLNRHEVLRLIETGYESPHHIRADDAEVLRPFLSEDKVEALLKVKFQDDSSNRLSHDFVIEMDEGRPDKIFLNGHPINLTPLQASLIRTLSNEPGKCVSYDKLLEGIWGDGIGERKQISRQKNLIKSKVEKALGKTPKDLLETVPGVGITLRAKVVRRQM